MKADDYTALAVKLDGLLETQAWSEVEPLLGGLGPKAATVATRLQELWEVPRFALPPLVRGTPKARAAAPIQPHTTRHVLVIPGPAVAAQRPRVFRRGGIGIHIPSLLYRRAIQAKAWMAGMKPIESDTWAISVFIHIIQPNPLDKPDCDNVTKNVMDAFELDGYFRDQRVINQHTRKFYGAIPHTRLEVAW
jgi:Holliday junction resolvase RusA-like endonuclease